MSALTRRVDEDRAAGRPDLRSQFEELRRTFCRSDARTEPEATKRRTRWIGELRRLLAGVCLKALEPDLIILDEFQRFKHLLEERSEAGELAKQLFESEAGQGARVLLLSATPYRALSLYHEKDDDHYTDFIDLLRFLENGQPAQCTEVLAEYRSALPAVMNPDGLDRLRRAKEALQMRLRRVMTRTERLALESVHGGMLHEAPTPHTQLSTIDVHAFLGAQRIADMIGEGDLVEYWKSAPYLFNFMDVYALKRAFIARAGDRDLVRVRRQAPEAFLDFERARAYQPLSPANPRVRGLLAETVDRGLWRLLWMPSALNYYRLAGPFAAPELAGVTKRLVFSAWHMVPRAVASLVSYEAERRMMRAAHPRARLTQEDWKKQRGLLRFSVSADRSTGLPLMLLVYPCLTFARDCDPRDLARANRLSASEVRAALATRIRGLVDKLALSHNTSGNPDESWYWLVPMLLDCAEFSSAARSWWERADLARTWAGAESDEDDTGWLRHVNEAGCILKGIRDSQNLLDILRDKRLGPPPSDLFDVLALAASAAPATAALRAYARITEPGAYLELAVRDAAARTGRAFLALFNHAEVIEMLRAEFRGEPYWERVLEYAHAGGLQAVLDEYAHLLRESLGLANTPPAEAAEMMATEVINALTLRTASLRVDEITAPPFARQVSIGTESMHVRFAMRFGDERSEQEAASQLDVASAGPRKERVRGAFNSPFWPFVLVSTSVGQEGLDFHHYCHAITHWNLPANPVDLEQREGRVHRYKGHAVRKNLAALYTSEALNQASADVWEAAFALGRARRRPDENDLVPYWHFAGDARIERHVPLLPFSREVDRFDALRRSLVIYRMVFGQSRQEDLIAYLLSEIPESDRPRIVAELRIDLSPLQLGVDQPSLEEPRISGPPSAQPPQ